MAEANNGYQRNLLWLKRWIWVYFWLLIFEGALRKWFLHSLSGPLLLVRDPVAVMIYFQAVRCRKLSMQRMWPFAALSVALVVLACAQIAGGIGTLPIAAFGLRSYLLHLPLIFVVADTLDAEDIRAFGRWLLLLSIPMTLLVIQQYRSPADAWVNAGATSDAWSGQILAARGHIRPAGTFSFGIGMQYLEMLIAAFVLDAITRKDSYPRWLVYGSLFATFACIPLLGSRTVLFSMAVLCVFALLSGMTSASRLQGILKIAAVVLLVSLVAIQLPIFNDAVDTMTTRWQSAARQEGDVEQVLDNRVFRTFEWGFEAAGTASWLGKGLGMGSNYAAISLTGEPDFLMGEAEWIRVVLEMGSICGLLFLGARIALALYLVLQAKAALARNAPLAWLLLPLAILVLIMGVMEQATALGFLAFSSGLCLAAARCRPRSDCAALAASGFQ